MVNFISLKDKFGNVLKQKALSLKNINKQTRNVIEKTMKKYGNPDTLKIYEIPYRRYKSRNATLTDQLRELLIYIEKWDRT